MNKAFRRCGFSLVEMTVVLALVGVLTGGAVLLINRYLDVSAQRVTEQRMELIADALRNQRSTTSTLPCPSDSTLATTHASFGKEQAPCGTVVTGGGGNARMGGVPTRKINIPDEWAFDGWGNRFTYVMDVRLNTTGFTATYPITDTSTIGDIEVRDASGTARTTKAVYAIISFGKNGHGAYKHNGATDGTEATAHVNAGSTNTDELENCDCTSAGVVGTRNNVYIQKQTTIDSTTPSNSFDDVVLYRTRWQVSNYNE